MTAKKATEKTKTEKAQAPETDAKIESVAAAETVPAAEPKTQEPAPATTETANAVAPAAPISACQKKACGFINGIRNDWQQHGWRGLAKNNFCVFISVLVLTAFAMSMGNRYPVPEEVIRMGVDLSCNQYAGQKIDYYDIRSYKVTNIYARERGGEKVWEVSFVAECVHDGEVETLRGRFRTAKQGNEWPIQADQAQ